MAREDDLREHEQTARDILRRDIEAVVRVDIGILALVDVERNRMELALLERGNERFRIDEAAACSIREHDIVLHEGDGLLIDEMIRAAFAHDERCVNGDEVRALQDLFLRSIGEQPLFLELLVRLDLVPSFFGAMQIGAFALFTICVILSYASFIDYLIHFGKILKDN